MYSLRGVLYSLEHFICFITTDCSFKDFDQSNSVTNTVRVFVQQQTHSVHRATINPGLPQDSIAFAEVDDGSARRAPYKQARDTLTNKIKGQVSMLRYFARISSCTFPLCNDSCHFSPCLALVPMVPTLVLNGLYPPGLCSHN